LDETRYRYAKPPTRIGCYSAVLNTKYSTILSAAISFTFIFPLIFERFLLNNKRLKFFKRL